MAILKGTTVQTGADTTTRLTIDTNLTVDGKTAWEITGFQAYWSNGETPVAADCQVSATISTVNTGTTFSSNDEIARVNWAVANTGGVAVAYTQELIKEAILFESRVTAQPSLYLTIESVTTGVANRIYFQLQYNVVKLSDVELLRLMVGGA